MPLPPAPSPSAPTGADLAELWNRNFTVLRDGRLLQRKIAELGVHYPVLDLLVMRGYLRRDLALKALPEDNVFPSDLPLKYAEDRVLERAQEVGKLSPGQLVAAQEIVRSIALLGTPVTTCYVLVKLKHVRWKDLKEIDRQLGEASEIFPARTGLEDADTKERPALGADEERPMPFSLASPAVLEDMPTAEMPAIKLPGGRSIPQGAASARPPTARSTREDEARARDALRTRIGEIPDDTLATILRDTRLVAREDLDACLLERGRRPPGTRLGDLLTEKGILTRRVAEVLLETLRRTGRPGSPEREGAP